MEERTREGITVKELLTIPQLKEAVLLGGVAGLDRSISRMNVMDVPDEVNWVRPGEFLMTVGYPLIDEPEVLTTLIAQAAEKGVAALGIKTTPFFNSIPDVAIKAADDCGLPLIEFPASITFSEVVREVMERVLVAESRYLSILQSQVQRLSQVLLLGNGLPAFLHQLEALIHNPVVLLDPLNRWTASPAAEALCRQVEETEWKRLRELKSSETGFIRIGGQTIRVYLSMVNDEQAPPFLLLMMEYLNESGIVDTMTVNWAGELVGFEISNMQARQKIEAKYFDQFLQDWITGRIVSPVDLRLRAEACGRPLDEEAAYMTGIVSFHDHTPEVHELQELARRLNAYSAAQKYIANWTVLEEELVVLMTLQREEQVQKRRNPAIDSVWSMLQPMLQERRATLCLGREACGQSGVPGSYRDAKRTMEVGRICITKEEILHYGDLGIYSLLYRLQGTEELEEFTRIYLQPLLDYDRKHQGTFLKTLRTYFLCNLNAKETAERLFLHYNTINYRLDRIKSELGIHLDDPETRLQLQLAIKLQDIKEPL